MSCAYRLPCEPEWFAMVRTILFWEYEMKFFKKTLVGTALAMALAASAHASIINVDGVYWEPAAPNDFVAKSGFTQWFQAGATADATTAVNISGPASPIGQYLSGVGAFTTFNGSNNVLGTPNPETTPAQFAPDTQLTYEFGGIMVTGASVAGTVVSYTLDITSAYYKVWADPSKDYDETLDTAATDPLKTLFSSSRIDDVIPAAKLAERVQAAGKRTATLETFEGFTYTKPCTPPQPSAAPAPHGPDPDIECRWQRSRYWSPASRVSARRLRHRCRATRITCGARRTCSDP